MPTEAKAEGLGFVFLRVYSEYDFA